MSPVLSVTARVPLTEDALVDACVAASVTRFARLVVSRDLRLVADQVVRFPSLFAGAEVVVSDDLEPGTWAVYP